MVAVLLLAGSAVRWHAHRTLNLDLAPVVVSSPSLVTPDATQQEASAPLASAASAPQTWSLNDVRITPRSRGASPKVKKAPKVDLLTALDELRDAYAQGDYEGVLRRFPQVQELTMGST